MYGFEKAAKREKLLAELREVELKLDAVGDAKLDTFSLGTYHTAESGALPSQEIDLHNHMAKITVCGDDCVVLSRALVLVLNSGKLPVPD